MTFKIVDLTADNETLIQQVAEIMVLAFQHLPDVWDTHEEALEEVRDSFAEDRISRVAVADTGEALGWVGGIENYDGLVWELHPLCVHPDRHGRDIGTALVLDLEAQVKSRGGLVVQLGSDDIVGQTSLYGADLFTDPWDKVKNIQNLKRHPYEFYQKLGYVITGVVPDANGIGKPDIILSKRIV
jgi:aminoglycoside 6'-N-acetyltransferase I